MVGSIAAIAALFARQFIPGARGQLLVNIRVTSGIESRLDTQPPLTQIIAGDNPHRRGEQQNGRQLVIAISAMMISALCQTTGRLTMVPNSSIRTVSIRSPQI